MKGIGLCAIFSRQGDWAFDYALSLARKHKAKLNVFHFLESPYAVRRDVVFVDAKKDKTAVVTPDLIAKKDKELRLKYDERLGDYIDVYISLDKNKSESDTAKINIYEILIRNIDNVYMVESRDF